MKTIKTNLICLAILVTTSFAMNRIYGYEIVDEGNGYVKVEVEYVLPANMGSYNSGIYVINGSTLQLHRKKFKAVQFAYTKKIITPRYYTMNAR